MEESIAIKDEIAEVTREAAGEGEELLSRSPPPFFTSHHNVLIKPMREEGPDSSSN